MPFIPTQFNNNSQPTPVAACCGGTGLTSPGTSGNVLTSNGTIWVSSAPSSGGGSTSANGRISLFGPYRGSSSSYCWRSPGAGTAVIEIWGGGGGGGGGACCGAGIPGNSGTYSRSTITVTASGFVCGTVGGSTQAASNCIGCRGCSTSAVLAPAGSVTTTMCAEGGFGGMWVCNPNGVPHFCCMFANGYCGTPYCSLPPLSSEGCGFICNLGVTGLGQGTITAATAAGGDVNISGGISCTDFCNCNPMTSNLSLMRFYHSFPACDTRQPGHVLVCYCETASSFSRGEGAFELAYNRLTMGGSANPMRYFFTCMGCVVDCGCYAYNVNSPGIVGAGYGSQASMGGGETSTCCGSAGGPGLVKITWIG